MRIKIEAQTEIMSAFEKAGYSGKAKQRERLLEDLKKISKEKSPEQAVSILLEEINQLALDSTDVHHFQI